MASLRLVSPEGEVWDLDPLEAKQALAAGWKLQNQTSTAESIGRGFTQGASLGFGDELAGKSAQMSAQTRQGGIVDAGVYLPPEEGLDPAQEYAAARDRARVENTAARASHPWAYGISEGVGATLPVTAAMLASGGSAAPAISLKTAGLAAGTGAVQGLGGSEGTTFGELAADAGIGAGVGLAGLVAGAGVAKGTQALGRAITGPAFSPTLVTDAISAGQQAATPAAAAGAEVALPNALRRALEATVKPTPEAQFLRDRGVNLTVGQLNPRTPVGQIEEAATSLRYAGPAIESQRQAGRVGWQRSVMSEALPPGMQRLPPGENAGELLDAIYQGFKPAYESVKGEAVYPAIHMAGKGMPLQSLGKSIGAFERAAQDPAVLADDATRSMVNRFLQNQLTILPERQGAVGRVAIEDMMAMRSNIRDAVRNAIQQRNYAAADLLSNGEKAVTQAIESQIAPETAALMKAIDQKYWTYKVLEDAVSRAGDSPSGFTAAQLTASIKKAIDRGEFARGGGGMLRELSKAGRVVFESVTPPTGARYLAVGPWGEWGTGPAIAAANKPAGTSAQGILQVLQAGGQSMTGYEQFMRRLLTQGGGPAAVSQAHFLLYQKDPNYRKAMDDSQKPDQ